MIGLIIAVAAGFLIGQVISKIIINFVFRDDDRRK